MIRSSFKTITVTLCGSFSVGGRFGNLLSISYRRAAIADKTLNLGMPQKEKTKARADVDSDQSLPAAVVS